MDLNPMGTKVTDASVADDRLPGPCSLVAPTPAKGLLEASKATEDGMIVELRPGRVVLRAGQTEYAIALEDIITVRCTGATVEIVESPKQTAAPGGCCGGGGGGGAGLRSPDVLTHTVRVDGTAANNKPGAALPERCARWAERVRARCGCGIPFTLDERPLLILINPMSGKRVAVKQYNTIVAPYFKAAGVKTEVLVTTHAGHASEACAAIPVVAAEGGLRAKYRGVVIASGDGLLYEALQGIMGRPDWANAIRALPLGILPMGTGNGLAGTLAHDAGITKGYRGTPAHIRSHAFLIARGGTRKLDLHAVEHTPGPGAGAGAGAQGSKRHVVWSFLSVEWALFADIDIGSEVLRCLGPLRNDIYGVWRIICCLRQYRGRISWKPMDAAAAAAASADADAATATGSTKILPCAASAPAANTTTSPEFWWDTVPGKAAAAAAATTSTTTASSGDGESKVVDGAPSTGAAVAAPASSSSSLMTLPALGEAVPAAWETYEGNVTQFWACNAKIIAEDPMFATPMAELDDGLLHIWLNKKSGCCKMAEIALFKMEDGSHANDASCTFIPTTAMRLEPIGTPPPGIMAVDGERIPYGTLQVQVFRGMGTVFG